jgi:hypothetical protein
LYWESWLWWAAIAAPALAAPPRTVEISWSESSARYSYDGTLQSTTPFTNIGPVEFLQRGNSYHAVDLTDVYSIPLVSISGKLVITGSGVMSAEITYIREDTPLITIKDHIHGDVTLDPDAGTMTGTYTQYRQAYGTQEDVLAAFPYAVPDKSPNAGGWWQLDYTEYEATYPL